MDAPQAYHAVDSEGRVFEVILAKTVGSSGAYARAPVAPGSATPSRPPATQTGAR